MKHLIGVAVALAIATPAMGATEVVIPKDVMSWCAGMVGFGDCDIKPEERLVILTKTVPDLEIWELCTKEALAPGWRLEIMDLFHTKFITCVPLY
jgi:hypothetical protein